MAWFDLQGALTNTQSWAQSALKLVTGTQGTVSQQQQTQTQAKSQQVTPVDIIYQGATGLYKGAEQISSGVQTEFREHVIEPGAGAVTEATKWAGGAANVVTTAFKTPTLTTSYKTQTPTPQPKVDLAGASKATIDWLGGAASGGWIPTKSTVTEQEAPLYQQKGTTVTKAKTAPAVDLAGASKATIDWLGGAASGGWMPTKVTIEGEGLTGEAVISGAKSVPVIGSAAAAVSPVQERAISNVINTILGKPQTTTPIQHEATPQYLQGSLAKENPLLYKLERAFDITTGGDIVRQQRQAEITQYNAEQLAKPAIADAQKFESKFSELVQNKVLVGGKYTIDPTTNQKVYDYQSYTWSPNAKDYDIQELQKLSNIATTSYTQYENLQKRADTERQVVEGRTKLTTDVVTPYQEGFAQLQEDIWRKPIYETGDWLKGLAPKEIKPYSDVAIGTGAGFVSTLPYVVPAVFVGTQVIPYLPQHVERLIRSPAAEVSALTGVAGAVGAGIASQVSEAATGKDIYGETTGRQGEAIGSGLALIKGGAFLKRAGIASPVKIGARADFATGAGEISLEPPVYTKALKKIGLNKAEAIKVPETVGWKGVYLESPSVALQKGLGILPEGYSPEGSIKPIIGRISPTEGASSWIQRKQFISEVKSPEGKVISSSSAPYRPRLSLEVESPIYTPKTATPTVSTPSTGILSGVREVIAPKGEIAVGMPVKLAQYVAKEGYVPDYTAMSIATPLTQRLYRVAGTTKAAEISAAEMGQFKKIWQETSKPELVKNIETTLPKTGIVPKTITEQTVIYPKDTPVGKVSDWSGKPLPSDAPLGKVFHHTAYPDKGVWLTESEHTLIHDIAEGKVKLTPENTVFYDRYKVTVPKKLNPKVTELTLEERNVAAKELMDTIKKVDKNHTISGSLTEYLQAKVARLPKDLDMYTDLHPQMAEELGRYYKKYIGEDKVKIDVGKEGSSVNLYNEKTGKFDIKAVDIHSHEFGGKLGASIGRYGISSEPPIIVDGMNLMPLREQRLRKLSATMAVGKTPEGKFYSTAMDFRRFKDIGDVLGGSTSMESVATESIFGKRKTAGIAETRATLEQKIGPESPITAEHKQTAMKRYEEFAPTEPAGDYVRIPGTSRYYQKVSIAKGAAVVGGIAGGVAAGYVLSAPTGSAVQSVLGQKTQQKDIGIPQGLIAGIPLAALMVGKTKYETMSPEQRAIQYEAARRSLEITPETKFWDARSFINEARNSFGSVYLPKNVQVRVEAFEFEGVEGKRATPEFWKEVNKFEPVMTPNVRNIVKYGQRSQELLEGLSTKSDQPFKPLKTASFKPTEMKVQTYKDLMDLLSKEYKNRVVVTGSRAFDAFLGEGVGKNVFSSDVDITAYRSDLPKLKTDISKILNKHEPGRYNVELDPKGGLLRVSDLIKKEDVIEFHTFDEFPNLNKNTVLVKTDIGNEISVANPAQSLNSRMAGLYKDLTITDKTVSLTVKRIKDFSGAVGGFRQLAANYFAEAEGLKGDPIRQTQTLNNAKIALNMARSYEKYLFSKEIVKNIERTAHEEIQIIFEKARENFIADGKLPKNAKEITKSQALEVAGDLLDYDIGNLRGLSTKRIFEEIVHFRNGEMLDELSSVRKTVKNLADPTKNISLQSIAKSLKQVKTPLMVGGAVVGATVAAPYVSSLISQVFGQTDEEKERTGGVVSALIGTGAMAGLVRSEKTPVKKVPAVVSKAQDIAGYDYAISKYAKEPTTYGWVPVLEKKPKSVPQQRSAFSSVMKETTPEYARTGYPKSATQSVLGYGYVKTSEYQKETPYPKTPTYARTTKYPQGEKYPKDTTYARTAEYPISAVYPKIGAYTMGTAYPVISDYSKTGEYKKGAEYTKAQKYPIGITYPVTTTYPTTTTYPKVKTYPKETPYPKEKPYPKETPYPKEIPYPKETPYPGIVPYPTQKPKPTKYTKLVTIPPEPVKWRGKAKETEDIKRRKQKKKRVTPKHWEYGAGAEVEDVTAFVFGGRVSPKTTGKKSDKKNEIADSLSSGLFKR